MIAKVDRIIDHFPFDIFQFPFSKNQTQRTKWKMTNVLYLTQRQERYAAVAAYLLLGWEGCQVCLDHTIYVGLHTTRQTHIGHSGVIAACGSCN